MIVETGNQSKAAKRLNITQPALSKWLRELEQEIGQPLFTRGGMMKLTQYGELFHRYSEKVLNETDHVVDELEAMQLGQVGMVRIGVLYAVVPNLLPNALLQFRNLAPNVKITLQEDTLGPLLEKLDRHALDIVIGRMQGPQQDKYIVERLYDEPVCAVVRAGHPLLERDELAWSDTSSYPWITSFPGVPMRNRLEAEFATAGTPFPKDFIESHSAVINEALLRDSDMICLYSSNIAYYFLKDDKLKILDLPMSGELGPVAMYLQNTNPTKSVEIFCDIFRKVAAAK